MEPERVTSKLCNYLSEAIVEMIEAVQVERYEDAASIRDQIEDRISRVSKYIIKHKMTTLEEADVYNELVNLKWIYIRMWESVLEIEGESRINNI